MKFLMRLLGYVPALPAPHEDQRNEEMFNRLSSIQLRIEAMMQGVEDVKQYLARQEEIAKIMLEQGEIMAEGDDKIMSLAPLDAEDPVGKKGLN